MNNKTKSLCILCILSIANLFISITACAGESEMLNIGPTSSIIIKNGKESTLFDSAKHPSQLKHVVEEQFVWGDQIDISQLFNSGFLIKDMLTIHTPFYIKGGEIVLPTSLEESNALMLNGYLATQIPLKVTHIKPYDTTSDYTKGRSEPDTYIIEASFKPGPEFDRPWEFIDPVRLSEFFEFGLKQINKQDLNTVKTRLDENNTVSAVRHTLNKMNEDCVYQTRQFKTQGFSPEAAETHWRLKAATIYIANIMEILNRKAQASHQPPKFIVAMTGIDQSVLSSLVKNISQHIKQHWTSPTTATLSIVSGSTLAQEQVNQKIIKKEIDSVFTNSDIDTDIRSMESKGLATVLMFDRERDVERQYKTIPGDYNTLSMITLPVLEEKLNICITNLEINADKNKQQLEQVKCYIPKDKPALLIGRINSTPKTIAGQLQVFPEEWNIRINGGAFISYFLDPHGDLDNRIQHLSKFFSSSLKKAIESANQAGTDLPEKELEPLRIDTTKGDTLEFELKVGDLIAITGPSGSGKSRKLRGIGTYFKGTYGSKSVLQVNREYVAKYQKLKLATTKSRKSLIEKVMNDLQDPKIRFLMLDELEAGLSKEAAITIMQSLMNQAATNGVIVVAVTHYHETAALANHQLQLKASIEDKGMSTRRNTLPAKTVKRKSTDLQLSLPSKKTRQHKVPSDIAGELGGEHYCIITNDHKFKLSIPEKISFLKGNVYRIASDDGSGKTAILNFLKKRDEFREEGGYTTIRPEDTASHSPLAVFKEHEESAYLLSVRQFLTPAYILRGNLDPFFQSTIDVLSINAYDPLHSLNQTKPCIRPLKLSDMLYGVRLSDGQLARLGMGRCLASEKQFLLIDCPEAGLESEEVIKILHKIFSFACTRGQTIIFTANAWKEPDSKSGDTGWDGGLVDAVLDIDNGQLKLRPTPSASEN